MLLSAEDCLPDLRCPVTKSKLTKRGDTLACSDPSIGSAHTYPIIDNRPVLINFEQSVIDRETVIELGAASQVERSSYTGFRRVLKRLLSPDHQTTRENIAWLEGVLSSQEGPARLLIIGGGSVGRALTSLYEAENIQVYAFDIYASPSVQFVADAHALPLADDFFDAVIVQAVLEHVLLPETVVSEIWRVLKPDGLVYAETPFMQHVHEGAFDFTRFTDSGHRYLFRGFDLIGSGVCGGPGVQLMWSVDYFARGLFRSRTAGKLAKFAVFWAQYLDRLIPKEFAIDAASGVYFLGRKSTATVSPSEIIDYYKGAN